MRAAKLNAVGWTAVFALTLSGLASAQTSTNHWTVDSGETVGAGANVLRGQVGFPGLVGDFIHGLDGTTDIGGRMWINYSPEGLTRGTAFEWKIQLTLRKLFFDSGKVKIAGTFDPGFLLVSNNGTQTGITFPIGFQFGIPIDNKVTVNASFDIPFYVTFGDFGNFNMPLLFGGGVEYMIEPNLDLTFKLKLGPNIGFGTFGSTNLALYALFGVAYRF